MYSTYQSRGQRMAEMARKKSLPAATRRPECSVLTKPLKVIVHSTPRDNYSENYSSSLSPLDTIPMYSPGKWYAGRDSR